MSDYFDHSLWLLLLDLVEVAKQMYKEVQHVQYKYLEGCVKKVDCSIGGEPFLNTCKLTLGKSSYL